ncbi:hypothetical protein [Dyadobacter aurulentus]|uniref:hypothetical protein n=1 Tax=Dyadobacter sp. UC 10 TaxID=2605428 RepID=UPI0011F39E07|nr:hypothetical protein [Dyadobacter sp. UC 10]KAA0992423.1 hypothetical protein FXO21_20685 [Dyadobacter sp. UC 10]
MQKIRLFSQYDAAALFLKTKKELEDQVGQWPEEYFRSMEIGQHISSLKDTFRLSVPDIDFLNGRQVIVDRILPLSDYQPGMRRGINVRVSVLMYKYPLTGTTYLLGCRPSVPIQELVGEWYTDPVNQEIYVEYSQYDKHPKKVVNAHQACISSLQQAHRALKDEFQDFNDMLDEMIANLLQKRKEEAEHLRQMRMMLS